MIGIARTERVLKQDDGRWVAKLFPIRRLMKEQLPDAGQEMFYRMLQA